DEIVSFLHRGGIIAFPTDTAYGLGVDPFNDAAVDRLFRVKGRPEAKPILLVVDSVAMAESVSHPLRNFYEVTERFWPGPLTLVVQARPQLSESVTARPGTVGLRWPVAPFANTLVRRFGRPLTATSANRSGEPATITAGEVRSQLGDTLDALI